MHFSRYFPRSSNGRTTGSGPVYWSSNLYLGTKAIKYFIKLNYGGRTMTNDEEKKYAKIRSLCDIIGGLNSTEKQRQRAWEQLMPMASSTTLSTLIAAKYSWLEFTDEYKEKAWRELKKRNIENDEINLHYLAVNAPEPWCEEARELEEKT